MSRIAVSLDLETTGLDPSRDAILEIGAVKFRGDEVLETFSTLVKNAKLWTFVRSIEGAVKPGKSVNELLNRCDVVVSCLHPLYARSIEALAAGKGFLCAGYTDPEYPFHCDLEPTSMAEAIINLWEHGCGKFDFRAWAELKHNVADTVRQCVKIYEGYLSLRGMSNADTIRIAG